MKGIGVLAVLPVLPVLAGVLGAAAPNPYIDPKLCAGCHRDAAAEYGQTGMGRSFYRPTAANAVEDYAKNNQFFHALSDTHYAMIARDSRYYQRRWQIGYGGAETNVEESLIDYVVGSGNHSRTYLHRTERGTLIELPLSWYSEKGGYWGMSPQFDTRHPLTRRLISYECMYCHNAYPKIGAGNEAPGSEPVFPTGLPEGIDCQRCHGPGGNHIAAVKAGARAEDIRRSIVNPARLDPQSRMEVCLQCHLEPASTDIQALIRRVNRGPFSYDAGQKLSDFLLFFDYAPDSDRRDRFEIVNSSAYRLRESQCFLKSKGALTCENCHNPHKPASNYAVVCRQCHAAMFDTLVSSGKHTASTECIACHMPKRRTEDVVHVVMTDHLIQRRPPPGDLTAEIPERHGEAEYRGEVVPYYPADLPRTAEGALYRGLAQGAPALAAAIAAQRPREPRFYLELGNAWLHADQPDKAAAAFEDALRLRPASVEALLGLAASRPANAIPFLDRAIRIAPNDPRPLAEHGVATRSAEQVRKAIALNPDLEGGYTRLAAVLLAGGRVDEAQAALRNALRVDPYDAIAWDLTGRALAAKGAMDEALYNFEKALKVRPGYGPHLYDYALLLAQLNRWDDAQKAAESAATADPKLAEAHALLGQLFARGRQFPEAIREYRQTLQLRPEFSRVHLDLASVFAAQGNMPEAITQLREAVKGSDPAVAQQAAQALQRLGAK